MKMFQVVVSRIPTQPGARVRATQEGVSCLTSRLEPTSIDGRPAEMPNRVCPVAGGAGCLDISRAVPSPSQFNCLGRGYAFFVVAACHCCSQGQTRRGEQEKRVSSTLRFIVPKADSEASIGDPCGERELPPLGSQGRGCSPPAGLGSVLESLPPQGPCPSIVAWAAVIPASQPCCCCRWRRMATGTPEGVWEGPATIQVPVLSRLTLFCRCRALFHFWR